MSKSLKNFITIDVGDLVAVSCLRLIPLSSQQILRKYTARQLRLAFLLVLWNAKVDFQESTMTGEVRTIEMTFDVGCNTDWEGVETVLADDALQNFFTIVKALRAQAAADETYRGVYKIPERQLTDTYVLHTPRSQPSTHMVLRHSRLVAAQIAFRTALCDSFNTPQALDVLLKLVSRANVYITHAQGKPNVSVLENIARWVGNMLRMFGLGEGSEVEGAIGWGESAPEGETVGVDVCDDSFANLPSRLTPMFRGKGSSCLICGHFRHSGIMFVIWP